MRAERIVEGSPPGPELKTIAGEAARAFDLTAKAVSGGWELSGGTLFTADPESGVLVVRVAPEGEGLRLSARSRAFPGSGAKARRVMEARLTAVEDFFRARLRGRPADEIVVAPLYRAADPGLAGAVIAAAWVGLSTAAALLAAYAASVGLGCVLMRRQIEEQAERSRFVQMALQKDPLPRLEEINAAGPAEILGAAAVFAVPWGFLVGLLVALSLAWGELSARASGAVLWMARDLVMSALLVWNALPFDVGWGAGLAAMMLVSANLAGPPGRKIAAGIRVLVGIGAVGMLAWLSVRRASGAEAADLDSLLIGLALYLGLFAGPAVGFYVQVFLVLATGAMLLPASGPLEAAAFGMAIPLSAFGGYLALWGRRREKREDRDRQRREVDGRRAAFGLAAFAVMAAGLAWGAIPAPQDRKEIPVGMARFRDRMMMTNPVGRWLAEFYYRHTLPAAAAVQPAFEEHEFERLQRAVLMTAPEPSVEGVLRRHGAYVTEAWEAVMDTQDVMTRLDHPYDLIVVSGIVRSRQKGEDQGEAMEAPLLEELRGRGLWGRTLLLAPIRTHYPGANLLMVRLEKIMPNVAPRFGRVHALWKQVKASTGQEQVRHLSLLKTELDRTPWDAPEGFPPDQVMRLPYEDEEEVMARISRLSGQSFPGRFLRDGVAGGWLSVFYLGGLLAVGALVLPPAVMAALLYRRRGRRAALIFCGALCAGSIGGLIVWGGPGAAARAAIAELRVPASAARTAELMDHPEADVRYEAVFGAERRLKATRVELDGLLDDIDTLQNMPMTGPIDQQHRDERERRRLLKLTGLWEKLGQAQERHEALATALGSALVRRLEDPDVRVRVWACGALGQRGIANGSEDLEPLLKATRDPEFFVRYRAAEALSDVARYRGNTPGTRRANVSRQDYDVLLKAGKVAELMVEEGKVTARLRDPTRDYLLKEVFFPHVLLMIPGLDEAVLKELTAADPPPNVRRPIRERVGAEVIPRLQEMVREDRWYVGNYALRALRRIKRDGDF